MIHVRWGVHARERAAERAPHTTPEELRQVAELRLAAGLYEVYWEWDDREARGECRNLLIRACDVWVLLRIDSHDPTLAHACSVLWPWQYENNKQYIWFRTRERLLEDREAREQARRAGLSIPARALTQSPFAKLANKK